MFYWHPVQHTTWVSPPSPYSRPPPPPPHPSLDAGRQETLAFTNAFRPDTLWCSPTPGWQLWWRNYGSQSCVLKRGLGGAGRGGVWERGPNIVLIRNPPDQHPSVNEASILSYRTSQCKQEHCTWLHYKKKNVRLCIVAKHLRRQIV